MHTFSNIKSKYLLQLIPKLPKEGFEMGVVLPNKRGTIQIIILYLLLFSLSFSVRHVPGIVPGVPFPYIPEEL